MKAYIGIDNGVTGSIGYVDGTRVYYTPIPVKKELSYSKAKAYITRVDFPKLMNLLTRYKEVASGFDGVLVLLERPFTGKNSKTVSSGMRALESTLICLESLNLPYQYIDSGQWQRVMLSKGLKGSAELKKASMDIGCRLFPFLKSKIVSQKDADGLLIAEWARRGNL